MNRKLLCALMGLVAVMGLNSCNKPQQDTLVVGLECDYQPFNWTEIKSESTKFNVKISGTETYADGYDIQIAKIIADELNKELVIKKMSFDGLVQATVDGVIDLVIAGMSPTEERKVDIDFTNPYYTSEHVLLVAKDNPYSNVTSVSELAGARISGQNSTLYKNIAHAIPGVVNTPGMDKDSVPNIVQDILTGTVDGTVLELPVAQGLVAGEPSLKFIQFEEGKGFTQLLDDDAEEPRDIVDTDKDVSIGLAKGQEKLLNSINDILDTITTDRRNQLMSEAVARFAAME